ncbi:MAG: adenylosuccinate lyase [Armatimonadetes bacterium]|nr:adenylosuccinate lyase [Armatimonadota bacterium]MDW8121019.1 adenylosuccinate lyase [Armatimonadota bacterium]
MWERYSYPEMRQLWSLENKFRTWMKVELAICDGWAQLGVIPEADLRNIHEKASFTVERVLELEKVYDHDLLAFVRAMTEQMGDEAKFVHMGVTSYDVEDTALGLLLKESCEILQKDLDNLIEVVRKKASEHKMTIMMGRTHGVHAEPITFGLKLLNWLSQLERHKERLEAAKKRVAVGKISGAVGTYATIDPRLEALVLSQLGLDQPKVSSQILQRDRHCEYVMTLALIASSLDQFATEIRNLQRTEISEVQEPFRAGQRGSSAMPHKRNPIRCERISGLSRLVKSWVIPAMENITTWHERDLSNSSVERVILPESSILVDYMLRQMTRIIDGLVVFPEAMKANLEITQGVIFSQRVLLALIHKGWSREEAYEAVQRASFQAVEEKRPFRQVLSEDSRICQVLTEEEMDQIFDYSFFVRHVPEVFSRFGL